MNQKFKKGHTPWNKGLTGYMSANKTSFNREILIKKYPNYVPHEDGKGGLFCLTNDRKEITDTRTGKVYLTRKRKSYARALMEQHLGRNLEPNEVVYHKDHDYTNNALDNLEVITRSELIILNRKDRK